VTYGRSDGTDSYAGDNHCEAHGRKTGTADCDRPTVSVLQSGTITAVSGVIANAAIGTAQIAIGAIGNAQIANAAVGTANIQTAAITNALISSVGASKLTAGTIDASVITVTNLNCANLTVGTINGAQITTGAIGAARRSRKRIQFDAVRHTRTSVRACVSQAHRSDKD